MSEQIRTNPNEMALNLGNTEYLGDLSFALGIKILKLNRQ